MQDSGVGIAPAQLAQIFQPFEQLGSANQRAAGTGLGLAISQQLAELMGGQITVASTLGRGSTFTFEATFPQLSSFTPSAPDHSQLIRGYDGPRRRILVVDDRPENRMVLLNLLAPVGFEIYLAEHGSEGVAMAEEHRPDLIFMDLIMPVMMGFEAVGALRAQPEFAATPIIAVTASVLAMDQAESRRVGCTDFLSKPVEADRVFAMLATYLGLTWITTAPDELLIAAAAPQGTLEPPPAASLARLYELARFGDMEAITEFADELATHERYQVFAARVRELASEFDDESIQALAKQFMAADSPPAEPTP